MGKLVVSEVITLDGVIEAPGGAHDFKHAGWSFEFDRGDEGNKFKFDELMASDVLLLGRVPYDGFAQAWPTMNAIPKYVVSTTLTDEGAIWTNSTVIRDDVASQVSRAKEGVAGDVPGNGSARLGATLAEHDLVDEYRLMVFPIVLGSGQRLFGAATAKTKLRLLGSNAIGPDGVLILTYAPVS